MSYTSVVESTRQYMSGFRIPDFQKLWYGSSVDQTDSRSKTLNRPFFIRFEGYLVRLQELSLWTDPKNSIAALVAVHCVYWYLSATSNTPVYLLASLASISFLYTTWTQRIWPEIRVPEADPGPDPDWTPVSPDVLSAPELVKLWEDFRCRLCRSFRWLGDRRKDEPGKFCWAMSTLFLLMTYIGSSITTLGLLYYISVGYLLVPGVLKILVKYPAVQCMLETMEEYRKSETASKAEMNPVDEPDVPAAPSLVDSVYSSLQSGLEAVSNLNLKSEVASIKESTEDDSYLPEEDEANRSILESAINSNARDPTQAHNLENEEIADSSLEYASLLPVAGDVMPNDGMVDDDLDSDEAMPAPLVTSAETEEDEFLPSISSAPVPQMQSRPLLDHDVEEEDDEFAASLMAAAAASPDDPISMEAEAVTPPAYPDPVMEVPKRRLSTGSTDMMDDFEMISEEELAQVSP